MGLLRYLRGDDILDNGRLEDRAITPGETTSNAPWSFGFRILDPPSPGGDQYRDVTTDGALRVHETWACIRALADAASSLPRRVYRRQADGSRTRAGDDTLAVRLLGTPMPGLTT